MITMDTGQKNFQKKVLIKKNDKLRQNIEQIASQKLYLNILENSILQASKQKEHLKEKIDHLKQENVSLKVSLTKEREQHESFQKEIDVQQQDLSEALAKIFHTEKETFKELIEKLSRENQEAILKRLSKLSNRDDVIRELLKYNELSKHFYPIDLKISKGNILFVKNEKTNIKAISEDMVKDLITKKINEAQKVAQGIGRIILLWSYDRGATEPGKKVVKGAVEKISLFYGFDKMIVANCGYIPRGKKNEN